MMNTVHTLWKTVLAMGCAGIAGCGLSTDSAKRRITEHYGEPCSVESVELSMGRGLHVAVATLVSDPDIRFTTEFTREDNIILRSNYPQMRWRAGYTRQVSSWLDATLGSVAFKTSFSSSAESTVDPKRVPTFEELSSDPDSESSTVLRVHVFQARDAAWWARMATIIQSHKAQGFTSSAFELNFYDPGVFGGTKPDGARFGFDRSRKDDFERLNHEHLQARILFTLALADPIPSPEDFEAALDTQPNPYVVRPHGF